jgi:hypothetical protein
MNNDRRNQLGRIIERLRDAHADLVAVIDDEQSYYDNMPESLQSSDKGDASQEAIDNLSSAGDSIESAISDLESAAQ